MNLSVLLFALMRSFATALANPALANRHPEIVENMKRVADLSPAGEQAVEDLRALKADVDALAAISDAEEDGAILQAFSTMHDRLAAARGRLHAGGGVG